MPLVLAIYTFMLFLKRYGLIVWQKYPTGPFATQNTIYVGLLYALILMLTKHCCRQMFKMLAPPPPPPPPPPTHTHTHTHNTHLHPRPAKTIM